MKFRVTISHYIAYSHLAAFSYTQVHDVRTDSIMLCGFLYYVLRMCTEHRYAYIHCLVAHVASFVYPRGSKTSKNEYLAQAILILPYVETRSPHFIGTWTLRVCLCIKVCCSEACCKVDMHVCSGWPHASSYVSQSVTYTMDEVHPSHANMRPRGCTCQQQWCTSVGYHRSQSTPT